MKSPSRISKAPKDKKAYQIKKIGLQFISSPQAELDVSALRKILTTIDQDHSWDDGTLRKKQQPGIQRPSKIVFFSLVVYKNSATQEEIEDYRKKLTTLSKKISNAKPPNVSGIRPLIRRTRQTQ